MTSEPTSPVARDPAFDAWCRQFGLRPDKIHPSEAQFLLAICAAGLPTSLRIEGASADFALLADDAGQDTGGGVKLKRFTATAYTGVPMKLRGWPYPVVVDLAGMRVPNQAMPAHRDHDPDRAVGHTTSVAVTAQRIKCAGVISGVGPDAQEVSAMAANGFPWQMSLGADADSDSVEFLDRGKTANVNGRNVTGPAHIVRASALKELSFVTNGADGATSATIAARSVGDTAMNFATWLKAKDKDPAVLTAADWATVYAEYEAAYPPGPPAPTIVPTPVAAKGAPTATVDIAGETERALQAARETAAAEVARQTKIARICAQNPDLEIEAEIDGVKQRVLLREHAIRANMDPRDVELAVLRASRPAGPFGYAASSEPEITPLVLEAACYQAGKLPMQLDSKLFSDQVMQAAHTRFRGQIGLVQLMVHCARFNGYRGSEIVHGHGDLIRVQAALFRNAYGIEATGFSDGPIANLLANVQNKFLLAGYTAIDPTWRFIAAMRPVKDFKPTLEAPLLGDYVFSQVGPDGELKHAVMGDQKFSNTAQTYGRVHTVSRQDIINDDLGALTVIPLRLGRGAALKLNNVFWTLFLNPGNADDGNAFWNSTGSPATHGTAPTGQTAAGPNYFTGAATNLQSSSLATALALFRNQVDPNGQPLGISPAILLAGPTNEVPAEQLLKAPNLVGTGVNATNQPNYNVWSNKQLRPAITPYLENTSFTGNSTVAWYLLANPDELPVIQACFLNGQEQPTVQILIPPPGMLGIPMQGFFDFGVAMFNFRGGVKSKGSA